MVVLKRFAAPEALFHAAALDFSQRAKQAVQDKGAFNVVLSGGSTPKAFFDALTSISACRDQTPWEHIRFFFSDERYLSQNSPDNNFNMACKYLFSQLAIPAAHIYPIPTHYSDPVEAAAAYSATLQHCFQLAPNTLPVFDLVYLGLGADAHTASLLPGSSVLQADHNQMVAALWAADLNMHRITLTAPLLNNASDIVFMVTGANKAPAVRSVLEGATDTNRYPAQLIHGPITWYLDAVAAEQLDDNDKSA